MAKVLFGDVGQIACGNCCSTILEDEQEYTVCCTPIDIELQGDSRANGDEVQYIIDNNWYIPKDRYNQPICYCRECGKKLQWLNFFKKNVERWKYNAR